MIIFVAHTMTFNEKNCDLSYGGEIKLIQVLNLSSADSKYKNLIK